MNYWILKSEPDCYSWDDMVRDQKTFWNGIRNFQTRKNLNAMEVGDLALFYHSGDERALRGIVEVVRAAYPDSTAKEPGWVMVDIEVVKPLETPVTLTTIKQVPEFSDLSLVRQGRLSVSSIPPQSFDLLLGLSKTTL